MVKVDLITGFLGAGKTTFLLKYGRYFMDMGQKIGILEYDYGAVNIDMLLVGALRGPKCELEMIDASGDAESTKRRFRTKLIAMAMTGYDRIIIEPSGVFDMDIFYDTLRDEPLESMAEIGSVITIVNSLLPENIDEESNFFLASQASCAGSIVMSRTQQADESDIEGVKRHIEAAAEMIRCGKIKGSYVLKDWDTLTEEDFKEISESGYHISDYMKLTAGRESSFSSLCFMNPPENLEFVKKAISALFSDKKYGNIFRVKGFIKDGEAKYRINATADGISIEEKPSGQSVLIVIGNELYKDRIDNLLKTAVD